MSEIKDWRGTEIEVGDVILYAVKHSTSVEVNEAVVSEVGMKPQYSWSDEHLVPTVIAEWQRSSYCYVPNRARLVRSGRQIRRVKLTNFEGITVVAKGTPPAWARIQHPIEWGKDADL